MTGKQKPLGGAHQAGLVARKRSARNPTIEEVKAGHSPKLMALEGVVGVGVEEDERGEPFLCVMVERKGAPGVSRIPRTIAGFRVEVTEVGAIRARVP